MFRQCLVLMWPFNKMISICPHLLKRLFTLYFILCYFIFRFSHFTFSFSLFYILAPSVCIWLRIKSILFGIFKCIYSLLMHLEVAWCDFHFCSFGMALIWIWLYLHVHLVSIGTFGGSLGWFALYFWLSSIFWFCTWHLWF